MGKNCDFLWFHEKSGNYPFCIGLTMTFATPDPFEVVLRVGELGCCNNAWEAASCPGKIN